MKNSGINVRCDTSLEFAIRTDWVKSEDFYLIQALLPDFIKSKLTWQTNGEKAIEEQQKDNGYES